jgi:hypothetical protein
MGSRVPLIHDARALIRQRRNIKIKMKMKMKMRNQRRSPRRSMLFSCQRRFVPAPNLVQVTRPGLHVG